jgi:hypothetical protein
VTECVRLHGIPFIVGIWFGWKLVVTSDGPMACGIWPPDWPATHTPGNRVGTVPLGQSAAAGAAKATEPEANATADAAIKIRRRFTVTRFPP